MRTREDIEAYLLRSGQSFEEVAPETWVVRDVGGQTGPIVVRLAGEIVLFRLKVLALAEGIDRAALFERLLSLNATDMVHGAYGLAEGAVVLTCSLRAEHLDYSEFVGTLDDFSLAVTNHHDALAALGRAPAA
jgi:hypothetical protein